MLEVKNINFGYTKELILENISISLSKGSIVTILGESGSGKSTLLKLIYGLMDWTQGEIIFNNEKLLGPKGNLVPGEKAMKWVSQEFDLMPYTTVAENVGMFFSNIDLQSKEKKVADLLKIVDLVDFKNTQVKYLSGGQKQRVALAKALSENSDLLLLDEPFSQIDNFRKTNLQRNFFSYLKTQNRATLMVTHNINDALSFSDYIYILHNGKFVEWGRPQALYKSPKKLETAKLFGEINIINGKYFGKKNEDLFLHPFQLHIAENGIEAEVVNSFFRGHYYLTEVRFKNQFLYCNTTDFVEKGSLIKLNIST